MCYSFENRYVIQFLGIFRMGISVVNVSPFKHYAIGFIYLLQILNASVFFWFHKHCSVYQQCLIYCTESFEKIIYFMFLLI